MGSEDEVKVEMRGVQPSKRARAAFAFLVALVAGLIFGTTVLLLVFGGGAWERAASITVGGGLAVGLAWVVNKLPDIATSDRYWAACVGIVTAMFVWVAECGVLGAGYPNPVPGTDPPAVFRVRQLESRVKQLERALLTDAHREEAGGIKSGVRWWTGVAVRPRSRHVVIVELTGVPPEAVLEVVAVDERGQSLGGRRVHGERSVRLSVTAGAQWTMRVGVRWWVEPPGATGEPTSVRPQPAAAGVVRLTVAPVEPDPVSVPEIESVVEGPDLRLASDDSRFVPAELDGSCVASGAAGRAFALQIPRASWVSVQAEATTSVALLLLRDEDGSGEEVACTDTMRAIASESDEQSRLTASLEVMVPNGRYVLFATGPGLSENTFTADGRVRPLAHVVNGNEVLPLPTDERVDVDLLSGSSERTIRRRTLRWRDIRVHAVERGVYRVFVELPAKADGTSADWFTSGLGSLEPPVGVTWLDAAGQRRGRYARHARIDLSSGEGAFLRVAALDPDEFSAARLRVERVDAPQEPLASACAHAAPLQSRQPWEGSTSGAADGSRILSLDRCATGVRARSGGSVASGPEAIARLDLRTETQVQLDVSPSSAAASPDAGTFGVQPDFLAYIVDGCDPHAFVVACDDDGGDGANPSLRVQLQAGTYYVVVDGYSADDSGPFTAQLRLTEVAEDVPEW